MSTDPQAPTSASQPREELPDYETVSKRIGQQISDGILARIESFPKREARLGWQAGKMDSLPEDILWDGLGEESPAVFVVYKLIHEAFSNAPQFFRTALVEFLRAQPKRFSTVFNRETIWSVLAALPPLDEPGGCPAVETIAKYLTQAQRRGIWWRSDEEIRREAEAVYRHLTADEGAFERGFAALKALQLEKARGITAGKLLLLVPGRLAAFADEVISLGRLDNLPPLKELLGRVDEFSRDQPNDVRHVSIPLDLLYTTEEDDFLHVRILTRAKADESERAELRRRSLYLRYFLRKAFAGYQPEQLDVKLAFYLDSDDAHLSWHGSDSLFKPEEWICRKDFWNGLCPGVAPEQLFGQIREAATSALTKENVVAKLKSHFNRASAAVQNQNRTATPSPVAGSPRQSSLSL